MHQLLPFLSKLKQHSYSYLKILPDTDNSHLENQCPDGMALNMLQIHTAPDKLTGTAIYVQIAIYWSKVVLGEFNTNTRNNKSLDKV